MAIALTNPKTRHQISQAGEKNLTQSRFLASEKPLLLAAPATELSGNARGCWAFGHVFMC
jgi:hypothetical protein